ncbi:lymphocyte antigen 6I-like [Mus pahari]|uniref:lymphocyte antigen 6I-like n=1 Tax=Mus pahari TaxID=10093 RepID=UPI000A30F40D|nr:lymphocyte antigen 6I-like [Mus pahari]
MDTSHAAKSRVLILLVVLLCAERAQGLRCYQCFRVPLETSCPSITYLYPDVVCVAKEEEFIVDSHRRKVKSLQCNPFCPADIEKELALDPNTKMNIYCCMEDLCNAAVPTGGSSWTMAGVLLCSMGSVLLQTLM